MSPKPAKKAGRRKPGRPRKHDRGKVMRAVCARISKGELVKYAAKAEGTDPEVIRQWGLSDEFAGLYARAREQQAHSMAEEAVDIADGSDTLTAFYEEAIEAHEDELRAAQVNEKRIREVVNELRSGLLQRTKLRLDTRKWLTSKIAPKLYGERLAVTDGEGKPLVPSAINVTLVKPGEG